MTSGYVDFPTALVGCGTPVSTGLSGPHVSALKMAVPLSFSQRLHIKLV
jgi:hypothetical protein